MVDPRNGAKVDRDAAGDVQRADITAARAAHAAETARHAREMEAEIRRLRSDPDDGGKLAVEARRVIENG